MRLATYLISWMLKTAHFARNIDLKMIPILLLYFIRLCDCSSPDTSFVVSLDSQIEYCDEDSQAVVDLSGMSVGRYNDTFASMNGEIQVFGEFDSGIMMELTLQKEASGSYEVVFSHEIHDMCSEIEKGVEGDYYGYLKYIDLPDKCPIPAGTIAVKELIVDTDDMPINSNTAGHYLALIKFLKMPKEDSDSCEKELVCCLSLKLVIESKY